MLSKPSALKLSAERILCSRSDLRSGTLSFESLGSTRFKAPFLRYPHALLTPVGTPLRAQWPTQSNVQETLMTFMLTGPYLEAVFSLANYQRQVGMGHGMKYRTKYEGYVLQDLVEAQLRVAWTRPLLAVGCT